MIRLRTKPVLFATIAIVLLFAAAAGAATLYLRHEYHLRHATLLQKPAEAPATVQTPEAVPVVPLPEPLKVQKTSSTPSVSSKVTAKATVSKPLIVPAMPATASSPIAAPIAQDHCSNIDGVQPTVPEGMSHSTTTGGCYHIPTQAEIDAANTAALQAQAEADNKAAHDRQTAIDGLNSQIAALDLQYSDEDKSDTYKWHLYLSARAKLVAERDVLTYSK